LKPDKQQHAAGKLRNSSSSTSKTQENQDFQMKIRRVVRDDPSPESKTVRTTGSTKPVAMGQHRGSDVYGPYRYQRVRAVALIGLHSSTLELNERGRETGPVSLSKSQVLLEGNLR
jgi:hypothetical protein